MATKTWNLKAPYKIMEFWGNGFSSFGPPEFSTWLGKSTTWQTLSNFVKLSAPHRVHLVFMDANSIAEGSKLAKPHFACFIHTFKQHSMAYMFTGGQRE